MRSSRQRPRRAPDREAVFERARFFRFHLLSFWSGFCALHKTPVRGEKNGAVEGEDARLQGRRVEALQLNR